MEVTKYYCDRCGKEHKYLELNLIQEAVTPNYGADVIKHDLCKACLTEFKKFIKDRKA